MAKGRVFQVATSHHWVKMAFIRWNVTGQCIHSSWFKWYAFQPVLACLAPKTPLPGNRTWICPIIYALNPSGSDGLTEVATAQRIISSHQYWMCCIRTTNDLSTFPLQTSIFRGLWLNLKHSLRDKSGIHGLGGNIIYLMKGTFCTLQVLNRWY